LNLKKLNISGKFPFIQLFFFNLNFILQKFSKTDQHGEQDPVDDEHR
jgi:hypothetical protein